MNRPNVISRASAPRAMDRAVAVGLVAIVVVFGARLSGVGFLGWDAYPILAASRSDGLGGLLDAVAEPLADGLMPASFYRPLLSLSIALEWPLWGLEAGGYLATNAVLFGLCGLALYGLVLRSGGGRLGAVAAVAFFVLHPVGPDVLPYLPRRPELLCTLFVLLALWLDHRGRFAASPASIAGAWLATAAAMGAKETAVALPVLVAGARWIFPTPGRDVRRTALSGFAVHGTIVAVGLLVRFRILGGVGGYSDTDLTRLPWRWPRTLARTLLGIGLPSRGEDLLALGAVVVLLVAGVLLVIARRAELGRDRVRLAVFCAIWILTFVTVYAAAGRLAPWYLLIVACGAAIGIGTVLELAADALRRRRTRPVAAIALAGGFLLLASFAVRSPLIYPPEELHLATRDATAFLDALEERVRRTPAGDNVDAGRYTRLVVGPDRRQVPVLVPHSLPGWALIVFPERELVFVGPGNPVPEQAGVTVVTLGRGIHKATGTPAASR